jgi:glycosyltransferase involved in cell wall biosynthesis
MAKIVFFNDSKNKSPAQSLFEQQLINHAAETSHEIYLVTDNDERTYHSKVQIMRAFRKWNLIEAVKFAPILFQLRADIFHFFQPVQLGLTHAFPILAAFARSSQTRNMTSLFGPLQGFSRGLKVLIEESVRVSVIDPAEETALKRRFPHIEVEVLPVQRFLHVEQDQSLKQAPPDRFIFLPENLDRYRHSDRLIRVLAKQLNENPDLYLLCNGSLLDFNIILRRKILSQFGQASSRILWTGPLNQEMKIQYMQRAQVVLLASLIHSPLLIFEAISLILASGAVSIIELRQVNTTQAKMRNNVHAKLIEVSQLDEALNELLANEELREVLRKNLAASEPSQEQDDLANQLNRAYVKLLDQDI